MYEQATSGMGAQPVKTTDASAGLLYMANAFRTATLSVAPPLDPVVDDSEARAADAAWRQANLAEIQARQDARAAEEAARPAREAAAEQAAFEARTQRQASKARLWLALTSLAVVGGGGFMIYRWLQKRKSTRTEEE